MERVGRRGDCWWWEGSVDKNGYGWFWAEGATVTAHRFSYELANGPISEGLQILHSCDQPTCVNPDHLLAGSHKQNVEERWERNPAWGESHHRCKYSDDDIREIRRLAGEGLTYAQIGERFGTGRFYIGEIVRRESRAGVSG